MRKYNHHLFNQIARGAILDTERERELHLFFFLKDSGAVRGRLASSESTTSGTNSHSLRHQPPLYYFFSLNSLIGIVTFSIL